MTTELREVLGLMPPATGPIARDFRAAGEDIPSKPDAEQAFVLNWLIGLAYEMDPLTLDYRGRYRQLADPGKIGRGKKTLRR